MQKLSPMLMSMRWTRFKQMWMDATSCPQCGSRRIRRSKRVISWEDWLARFQIMPFRCGDCDHRFSRRFLPDKHPALEKEDGGA